MAVFVAVGGSGVGVLVAGTAVLVAVDGTAVFVAVDGTAVFVSVNGTAVFVAGTGIVVAVSAADGVSVASTAAVLVAVKVARSPALPAVVVVVVAVAAAVDVARPVLAAAAVAIARDERAEPRALRRRKRRASVAATLSPAVAAERQPVRRSMTVLPSDEGMTAFGATIKSPSSPGSSTATSSATTAASRLTIASPSGSWVASLERLPASGAGTAKSRAGAILWSDAASTSLFVASCGPEYSDSAMVEMTRERVASDIMMPSGTSRSCFSRSARTDVLIRFVFTTHPHLPVRS
jgi:hypothetical protein